MNPDGLSSVEFASFFTTEEVLCRTPITDRDELLMALLKQLAFTRGIGHVPSVLEQVLAREAAGSTVVAPGIALPHARVDGIPAPRVAVATSEPGVPFDPGGAPVHLVLLVLVPKDQPAIYLQMVASLETILRNPEAAVRATRLADADEVVRFFQCGGMSLPGVVCAADVMEPPAATLLDTDRLKDAIDLFVAQGLLEIPVVDKEGDLVGVVSAGALLRVCMPEYLLWMHDLSPFLNFEPFVSVLRREERTWLSEIISEDYPVVRADQPAIAVAEAMARRNSGVCYVVRGQRLAGIVTLPHFLNKVLRD